MNKVFNIVRSQMMLSDQGQFGYDGQHATWCDVMVWLL